MLENYSGATRIYPILGDPIGQVKSPSGLTRAFEAKGRDAIVVPLHVAPDAFGTVLRALSLIQNVDGFIATMPHKFAAFERASSVSERASMLRSANVVRRTSTGGWHADVLDGLGFIGASAKTGFPIAGSRALLIGAGGAGGAIGMELLNSGVSDLAIHDTDIGRRDRLIEKLSRLRPGRVEIGSADPTNFDIVVNATPAGMSPCDPIPVDHTKLRAGMLVGDAVTQPEITPLLLAARRVGCLTQTGADMFNATVQLTIEFFANPNIESRQKDCAERRRRCKLCWVVQ
jgi:shikimate dehydrogenase